MRSPKIRAVFFDAGNTLLFPRLEDLAQDLTAQGYPATVEDFHAAERAAKQKLDEWVWPQVRKGEVPRIVDPVYWSEYLRALMDRVQAPESARERLVRRVADRFRDLQVWSIVPPDTAPVLEQLRAQGYYLAVVSNSIGTMEQHLARLGLGQYFQAVFDSGALGVEKPHPDIFRMALERAGVKGSEAVFVGDTHATDIAGAQLAGLTGVLFDRVGAYPHVECPKISSLPDLQKVLEEL
jgi:HAD superfamily hydrolase (TIGR01509 family)